MHQSVAETISRELERRILSDLYAEITRRNGTLIRSTYLAMVPFIEDVEFDTTMTPYEYFAMIQFSQAVREMRARMSKSVLDCEDLRDHMENLYCLYLDFLELKAAKGARVSTLDASYGPLPHQDRDSNPT